MLTRSIICTTRVIVFDHFLSSKLCFIVYSSDREDEIFEEFPKSILLLLMLAIMMLAILITLPHIDDFIYDMLVGEYEMEDENEDGEHHTQ